MTGGNDTRSASRTALSPTALPLAGAARLLSAAGGQRITVEMLEADIAAGAPTNPDGKLNLVHYAAWLVKQASGSGPQASGRAFEGQACGLKPDARGLRPGGPHD